MLTQWNFGLCHNLHLEKFRGFYNSYRLMQARDDLVIIRGIVPLLVKNIKRSYENNRIKRFRLTPCMKTYLNTMTNQNKLLFTDFIFSFLSFTKQFHQTFLLYILH